MNLQHLLSCIEKEDMFQTDSWNCEVSSYTVAKILRLYNLSKDLQWNLENNKELEALVADILGIK
jgi:hypothetical protein